jgi:precorrin-6B methylase 2
MAKRKRTKGQEEFEDTKGVIRISKSKKNREHNGQKNNGVHLSKTSCQTLKHFDNVFATGGNNIVEVFESLTT